MSRRGAPRRVYHRGQGRARWGVTTWLRFVGMGGGLLTFVGYLVWLYVIQPAWAGPVHLHVWLPLVGR